AALCHRSPKWRRDLGPLDSSRSVCHDRRTALERVCPGDRPRGDSLKQALRSDAIGLIGAATLGFAMLSPAMTLYALFGPTVLTAGRAAPLAFLWALVATLPTAVSYALLSRDFPLSGSAASWIRLAAPRSLAIWAGWMVFLYYFTNFICQPITLGLFA